MFEEEIIETNEDMEILQMCRKCYSFKYDNGWHFERPDRLQELDVEAESEGTSVQFSQCPSCIEEDIAIFEMEYV